MGGPDEVRGRGTMEPGYLLAKALLRPWLGTWFRWHIEGDGNIPDEGAAIVAFNHIAYLDPLAAAYVIDGSGRRPRFLAKAELFGDKRISWILRGAGQIPVERGTRDAPAALDHALRALERGEVVVIFPEGTITRHEDLRPMEAKSGVSRLALATGLPVTPAALWGTANVWGKGAVPDWRPGQDICVRIGEPLALERGGDTSPAWAAGGARIMGAIGELLASLRPVVPDRRRMKRNEAA